MSIICPYIPLEIPQKFYRHKHFDASRQNEAKGTIFSAIISIK